MTIPFDNIRHSHIFSQGNPSAEHKTLLVMLVTLLVMVAEIIGGGMYNSMALLADGWHMSSHVLTLGLSVFAWRLARHYADDRRFAFGSWKIEVLGGYTSAVLLATVAVLMIWESADRLLHPQPVFYNQAMVIAGIGLLVNLFCAWLLKDDDGHHHDQYHHNNHHQHKHTHNHPQHHDLNLRAAYLHVLADAATSLLAIFALAGGMLWGIPWLDPVIGIVGALVVASWAYSLLRDAGRVLLDAEMDVSLVRQVQEVIEHAPTEATISDLHIWRVGKEHYACILALISRQKMTPEYYRELLKVIPSLAHVTVEVNFPYNGN